MANRGDTERLVFRVDTIQERPSITPQGDNRGSASRRIRGKNGENIAKVNFKSIAKAGLLIRSSRMGNEALGSYTNNRLRQRKVEANMQVATWVYASIKLGAFGITYTLIDTSYRGLMYNIEVDKNNREAEKLRRRSGNHSYSGNRFGGRRL